jgi:hypothetical protein
MGNANKTAVIFDVLMNSRTDSKGQYSILFRVMEHEQLRIAVML